MDDFHLTLPSNVKNTSTKNTTSHYLTHLPKTVDLEGRWVVGLTEIQFPYSWSNIPEEVKVYTQIWHWGALYMMYFIVPSNHHGTIQSLMQSLTEATNKSINEAIARFDKQDHEDPRQTKISPEGSLGLQGFNREPDQDFILFYYDKPIERCQISLKTKTIAQLMLPPELLYMMGYREEVSQAFAPGRMQARYPPDLTGGLSALYIYCNICEHVMVGDTTAPLLRVVGLNTTNVDYGQSIIVTYNSPHYIPVTAKVLREIIITINDDSDKPIKFNYGKSILKLHFKRIK